MNRIFHPAIASWFTDRYGTPTTVQTEAWPVISSSENVLVVAPTGTGKTFAAFLWAINQIVTGVWERGATRVLYISPLKALNNDIRRNLIAPLNELESQFNAEGLDFPHIDVRTRSGDTPAEERRRMFRHPPEIFITTPESLNLILASPRARQILAGIRSVILDEIHAVINTKRGVHLMSAVERIVSLSGDFQRIALSATVKPLETVASFVGGYELNSERTTDRFHPRKVQIITPDHEKKFRITVRYPRAALDRTADETIWDILAAEFLDIIRSNRSTLLFANSRRLTERITLELNEQASELLAYAHHGSLSREIRAVVERRLKAGELRAIVATNSLELGIDIGALDTVVLVQCPGSVSSAIQRIGRAGHSVGSISTGHIYPTHPFDFIESTVIADLVKKHSIAPVHPVLNALDVLAQTIISMAVVQPWDIDELYDHIRTCFSYHSLPRRHFDLVIQMLEGTYQNSRIRELKPRILVDRIDNTITALKDARLALYSGGGVIPDRGYYQLRMHETGALVGDLDEEFVWEAKIGQVFNLGTQNWKIERITHNDVFVRPASSGESGIPFWRGERKSRDPHFSELIGEFLEDLDGRLDTPGLRDELVRRYSIEETVGDQIIDFLSQQRRKTGCPLPHRHHVLIEHIDSGPGGVPGKQIVLHTLLGRRINTPLAFALEKAWEERYDDRPRMYATNNAITILPLEDIGGEEILSLVSGGTVEDLLRSHIPESGLFGAHFRENAGRALLLRARKFGERIPLWMNRIHSQKLMDAVAPHGEFPITLETWRSILKDEFDLERLTSFLSQLEEGTIMVSESRMSYPSPFAQTASWNQINEYMYMGDANHVVRDSHIRADLMHDLLTGDSFRPRIPDRIIQEFEKKRLRLYSGYEPGSVIELFAHIKERGLIPLEEWSELLDLILRNTGLQIDFFRESLEGKLCRVDMENPRSTVICARERVEELVSWVYGPTRVLKISELWSDRPLPLSVESIPDQYEMLRSFISEWLGYYGPKSIALIEAYLGIPQSMLHEVLSDLHESGNIVHGLLREQNPSEEYCDTVNFETMLRMHRRPRRRLVTTYDPKWLALFIALHQGMGAPATTRDELISIIDRLSLLPLPVWLWESDVFISRSRNYRTEWIDALLHRGIIRWIGRGKEHIMFLFPDDLDLLKDTSTYDEQIGLSEEESFKQEAGLSSIEELFPDLEARYDFNTLLRRTGYDADCLNRILWIGVWEGLLSNDDFDSVRRAIRNRFSIPRTQVETGRRFRSRRIRRSHFTRWRGSLPEVGFWFRIMNKKPSGDSLEEEEIKKDRIRLLMGRYGILSREFLRRELSVFGWSALFRTMRIMELSGEIVGGRFFDGLSGPQFMSPESMEVLKTMHEKTLEYWLNAADPASVCGINEISDPQLPRRSPSNHLVYSGTELICVSRAHGKSLDFAIRPDDPRMGSCLDLLEHLLVRPLRAMRKIRIESINGKSAAESPYVNVLHTRFDVQRDLKSVVLFRSFS